MHVVSSYVCCVLTFITHIFLGMHGHLRNLRISNACQSFPEMARGSNTYIYISLREVRICTSHPIKVLPVRNPTIRTHTIFTRPAITYMYPHALKPPLSTLRFMLIYTCVRVM